MESKKKFQTWWDYAADVLHVKVFDNGTTFTSTFSKEFLEDTSADKFMEIISTMSPDKPATLLQPIVKIHHIAELLMPGIRHIWHTATGGTVAAIGYRESTQTYRIKFNQGFIADFPKKMFEDEQYHYIRQVLLWLAPRWQTLVNVAAVDVPVSNVESYTVGLEWDVSAISLGSTMESPLTATEKFQQEVYKFAAKYSMNPKTVEQIFKQPTSVDVDTYNELMAKEDAKIVKEIAQTGMSGSMLKAMFGPLPKPIESETTKMWNEVAAAQMAVKVAAGQFDGKFHVIDLGEEMWAPTEMMKPLHWSFHEPPPPKPHKTGMWQTVQWADDFSSAPPKPAQKIIVHKSEVDKVSKVMDALYPGKVWLVDEMEEYFKDTEKQLMKMVQKKTGMSSVNLGQATSVKIPKNPKQVTKQTLDHFHKLLGGFSIFP